MPGFFSIRWHEGGLLSLNWREIDEVLDEIPFEDALIRDIRQPSHPQLILELYRPGRPFRVLFSFTNPTCRLHLLSPSRKFGKAVKAQRFVSFLRAHVRNGRIVKAEQIDDQRIVRIEVQKAGQTVILWCRLWAAAANMIATDPEGKILDALYRRPKRGEVSGGSYRVEEDIASTGTRRSVKAEDFSIRDLPGSGSFNQRIERFYFDLEESREAGKLRGSLAARLRREETRLLASLENLEKRMDRYRDPETLKKWGDLILSNLHTVSRGDRWLAAADNEDPNKIWDIELDPLAAPAQNAESYYRRYRKAKSGLENLKEERRQQQQQLDQVNRRLRDLAREDTNLESLRQQMRGQARSSRDKKRETTPGLSFNSGPFRILVGRNARENDELLRGHVRGNDTWLHARDYPGGYVFIRSMPGKSIPLDTLLDAGNLALLYSKGKDSGRGEVFYTQVKYLKRIKDAKTGRVIPTHEKNLHVKLDAGRIRRLQQNDDY
jgi:predicted ribosome quality control (RQC) complex YloA/Tae2 family protein